MDVFPPTLFNSLYHQLAAIFTDLPVLDVGWIPPGAINLKLIRSRGLRSRGNAQNGQRRRSLGSLWAPQLLLGRS
jgi:hypothetical protein